MKSNPNLILAWLWILLGFASGMVLGMFFHAENWLGGYGSFKRRMYRLGHISFFGLGAVNLLFWLTMQKIAPAGPLAEFASLGVHRRRDHDAGLLRGDGAFSQGAPDFRRAGRQPDCGRGADAGADRGGTESIRHGDNNHFNSQPSTFNFQPTMKRIGFIAMSGVRAHNPELTQLGLTLPGFVDRNKIIASLPSLGLLTLAGLTPDRFDIAYHEIADLKTLPDLPTDFDLVAISTFTAQFYEACDVADFYRVSGIPVVMGGITVSSLREQAKEHCAALSSARANCSGRSCSPILSAAL